jgi:transcriptional regulator with XRE-family HTH domain
MNKGLIVSNCHIGAAIRKRRRELALSQEQLAAMLNVTNQQVQRYESGKDRVSVERLQAVAFVLSVPIIYFFNQDGDEEFMQMTECERNLLSSYRKIQKQGSRELVAELLHKIIQMEGCLCWLAIWMPLFQALAEEV